MANTENKIPSSRLMPCAVLSILVALSCQQYATAQTPSRNNQTTNLRHVSVPGPDGKKVAKATIFIGDFDEDITHAVGGSSSFTNDTYGENYLAAYDQQQAVKDAIMRLPKNWPVNLVGHGIGGATASTIAVELAQTRRINILVTADPSGDHPDFSIINNSVGRWVNIEATGD